MEHSCSSATKFLFPFSTFYPLIHRFFCATEPDLEAQARFYGLKRIGKELDKVLGKQARIIRGVLVYVAGFPSDV